MSLPLSESRTEPTFASIATNFFGSVFPHVVGWSFYEPMRNHVAIVAGVVPQGFTKAAPHRE
jgi:hypothetical protein